MHPLTTIQLLQEPPSHERKVKMCICIYIYWGQVWFIIDISITIYTKYSINTMVYKPSILIYGYLWLINYG